MRRTLSESPHTSRYQEAFFKGQAAAEVAVSSEKLVDRNARTAGSGVSSLRRLFPLKFRTCLLFLWSADFQGTAYCRHNEILGEKGLLSKYRFWLLFWGRKLRDLPGISDLVGRVLCPAQW